MAVAASALTGLVGGSAIARLCATNSGVSLACEAAAMINSLVRGTELRYLLTDRLFVTGSATIAELVNTLSGQGFQISGRASKTVSDALRWEVSRGRVYRLRRGRYGPGWMPRSTEHRIRTRARALRAEVARLSREGGRRDSYR